MESENTEAFESAATRDVGGFTGEEAQRFSKVFGVTSVQQEQVSSGLFLTAVMVTGHNVVDIAKFIDLEVFPMDEGYDRFDVYPSTNYGELVIEIPVDGKEAALQRLESQADNLDLIMRQSIDYHFSLMNNKTFSEFRADIS